MSRSVSFCLALATAVILSGSVIRSDTPIGATSPRQVEAAAWTEVQWPFLVDQWGTGRAFRCKAADCGIELSLYLRPKIGFCNCTTGVSDDAELDRVGDVDLIGRHFAPRAHGRPITVGGMKGRSRTYAVEARRTALAIAFNEKCDVIVATLAADGELPPAAEAVAFAFLNKPVVLRWVETSLELKTATRE